MLEKNPNLQINTIIIVCIKINTNEPLQTRRNMKKVQKSYKNYKELKCISASKYISLQLSNKKPKDVC